MLNLGSKIQVWNPSTDGKPLESHWVIPVFEKEKHPTKNFELLTSPLEKLAKDLFQRSHSQNFSGTVQTFTLSEPLKDLKTHCTITDLSFLSCKKFSQWTPEKARLLGAHFFTHFKKEASSKKPFLLWIEMFQKLEFLEAFLEGFVCADYEFKKYFSTSSSSKNTSSKATKPSSLFLWVSGSHFKKASLETLLKHLSSLREALCVTRDWSNEPSNIGTPSFYADAAKALAKKYGLQYTLLSEKDAKKERMELFLAVGQGSEREGKIVILEYTPQTPPLHTLALVGKGITFDSGGISLKPASKMEDMKHDMTGAATVMGALILAALKKSPNKILAMLVFTENMPSGIAVQPGNILKARNGKTVEIINTDAEGRLILADALDYIQDFKPDAIVDIATLTGAVGVALGKHCAAILGNQQRLIESLKKAGAKHGERLWKLPLFREYQEDMKSDFADLKNASNDGYAGTIRAAAFLQAFIRKGTTWAHLDIASTAYHMGHLPYFPKKGASGAYLRTLAQWTIDYRKDSQK